VRKLWAVFLSEWIYVVRDRISVLMLILMPILFTSVLGIVFGGAGNSPLRIGLVPGEATVTQGLIDVLSKEKGMQHSVFTPPEAEAALRRGKLDAVILAPAVSAEAVRIMTDSTTQRGFDAYTRIMAVQAAVSGRGTAVSLAENLVPGVNPSLAGDRYLAALMPEVQVERAWKMVAEGVLQVSPGMLVMFILMFAAYSGEGVVQERANGTLRRLLATPISGWHYLAGRLLGKVSVGMVQFLCLAGFGAVVFHVNWGGAPAMVIGTGLIFTAACASFGLFLGVVCRTPDQLSATATTVCLALAALGGTWWPIEATPPALQVFGRLLPTGQAMKAFHALILYGPDGASDAKAAWLALGVWGLLFLVLGVMLFRLGWKRVSPGRA